MASAGYTTFDATLQGCKNGGPNPNGVNCNSYESKAHVYMSGGPQHKVSGLADGTYFFAVLAPGAQNAGFIDGAEGNLSSPHDTVANRTFTITGNEISAYAGTHAQGTAPNGRAIIGLAPFSDTPNAGGVYILAICKSGATTSSECKYDAFRIREGGDDPNDPEPQFPIIAGGKYYDANLDGKWNNGEVGIGGWPIDYQDGISGTIITAGDGTFAQMMLADTYSFSERLPTNDTVWFQTGNTVDQSAATPGLVSVTLHPNMTYTITVEDDATVTGIFFGNVCVGAGGGHTLGFWSNKNGQRRITSSDVAALASLNLRNFAGQHFNPTSKAEIRPWLLNATAKNMAYMLSVQMAAHVLNVRTGFVDGDAFVHAPGTESAGSHGFAALDDLVAEANALLGLHEFVAGGHPARSHMEALKNAFDRANNNKNFLQPSPATCLAAPAF